MIVDKTNNLFLHLMKILMIACLIVVSGFPSSHLQADQKDRPTVSGPASDGKPGDHDLVVAGLKNDLAKARRDFQAARDLLENTPPAQLGATRQEVNWKMALLKRKITVLEQHIEAHLTLEEIRHEEQFAAAAPAGPDKYGKGPPYTISIVDQFREDIFHLNSQIDEKNALRSLLLQNRELARKDLETSEKELRLATEALEKKQTGPDSLRLKWLRELALLENEVARLRTLNIRTQVTANDASIALYRKKLSSLEKQFAVVSADVAFTKEELDRKLSALNREQKVLEEGYKTAQERDEQDQENLKQAREMLAGADSDYPDASVTRPQIELLKAKADTSSQISDMYYYLIYAQEVDKILWKERYRLYSERNNAELKKAVTKLEDITARMRDFQTYIQSSVELSQGLVLSQEKKANENLISEKEKALAVEILEAHRDRAEFLSGNLPKINEVIRNTEQFLSEVRGFRRQLTLSERFFAALDLGKTFLMSFWNYELFVVDDTIFINGEKVTGQRAVTVGKVISALLILIIGFRLSAPVTRKAGALASRFFHASVPWVVLTEKIVHVAIFFSLLIFALVTVKIPLTVFAFMGGALAIGVGFGAQNLINNFISGVILLMEQPIKVDDIIEIDGMSGQVISVGTRCSQVRRFDGIDILVPNSDFLQKNVTNWTLSDQQLRVSISFGVAYGSNTRAVSDAARQVLDRHGRILKKPEPIVLFEDFGDSALIFTTLFWVIIDPDMTYRVIASDVRHMLSNRFAEEGIVIAFPQRDVHLDAEKPISVSLVKHSAAMGTENG